jgi:amylosucrase
MKKSALYSLVKEACTAKGLEGQLHQKFIDRFIGNIDLLNYLFSQLYSQRDDFHTSFKEIIDLIIDSYCERDSSLKKHDQKKDTIDGWFLSNELVGMSLYVDRFAGTLNDVPRKLDYLQELGINLLHLMPIFKSPEHASDGGYSVSDYRVINQNFGTLNDLKSLQKTLLKKDMYLMIDIVVNHTSEEHEWAEKARQGDPYYQNFFYVYEDRTIPDQMEVSMPEVFPDMAPGSFTYDEDMKKWVMTVFNSYQWDLNYTNPQVLKAMLDNIFFYANLGIDILRIDAPAFIWKQMGTTCQNLPEAHSLLQFMKIAVEIATPGMAILGEAIVAPRQIMHYFGKGYFANHECDLAYNATQMALQWDALATSDTRNMLANQEIIQQKPLGTTWINYTRCHDDIGLGFEDNYIEQVGYSPYHHREYLKNYLGGRLATTPSSGDLFGVNPKTNDARISGTLASLCGLEKAIKNKDDNAIQISIDKILLMQANSVFLGGIPMIYYGDELGYTNDYSYLSDTGKSYDNRWMHRPKIDWVKNAKVKQDGTVENKVFNGLQSVLKIRKTYDAFTDSNNVEWLESHNRSVVGFKRSYKGKHIFCLFNYSSEPQPLTYYVFDSVRTQTKELLDLWTNTKIKIKKDEEHLIFKPYQFYVLLVD